VNRSMAAGNLRVVASCAFLLASCAHAPARAQEHTRPIKMRNAERILQAVRSGLVVLSPDGKVPNEQRVQEVCRTMVGLWTQYGYRCHVGPEAEKKRFSDEIAELAKRTLKCPTVYGAGNMKRLEDCFAFLRKGSCDPLRYDDKELFVSLSLLLALKPRLPQPQIACIDQFSSRGAEPAFVYVSSTDVLLTGRPITKIRKLLEKPPVIEELAKELRGSEYGAIHVCGTPGTSCAVIKKIIYTGRKAGFITTSVGTVEGSPQPGTSVKPSHCRSIWLGSASYSRLPAGEKSPTQRLKLVLRIGRRGYTLDAGEVRLEIAKKEARYDSAKLASNLAELKKRLFDKSDLFVTAEGGSSLGDLILALETARAAGFIDLTLSD
jgi:hypothetical protein